MKAPAPQETNNLQHLHDHDFNHLKYFILAINKLTFWFLVFVSFFRIAIIIIIQLNALLKFLMLHSLRMYYPFRRKRIKSNRLHVYLTNIRLYHK